MKYSVLILVLSLFFGVNSAEAQFSRQDSLTFKAYEDTINIYSDSLFNSRVEQNRKIASYRMIKTLTSALKKENSYQYAFPNLRAISIVQPEDNTFRIFTWQLIFDNNTYRYFGAIQMNSKDLKLIPLIDNSEMVENVDYPVILTSNEVWLGALYYGIKKVNKGKKVYYTLFGFDGNNALSTRKIIEVLWFDKGEVRFGAPIFDLGDDEKELSYRYVLEYKKGVNATANFSSDHNKIIFDHLISEHKDGEGQFYTYVPDGSYDAFEWKKGKWQFIDKLFSFELQDGQFPTGN